MSTTRVTARWRQLYNQATTGSTATANTRVKFPGRTGTRLQNYAVTGYGKNTQARSLV